MAWENEQEFVDPHESIRQELDPVGRFNRVGSPGLHLVKRRLNVGAQLAYHRHPDLQPLPKPANKGWRCQKDTWAAMGTPWLRASTLFPKYNWTQQSGFAEMLSSSSNRTGVRVAPHLFYTETRGRKYLKQPYQLRLGDLARLAMYGM